MKRHINILLSAVLALGAVSCSKESPFEAGEAGNGYGRVLTSALAVQLKSEQTRAGNGTPDVKDFSVEFFNTDDLSSPVTSYKYSEMPEIVSLPAGVDYKVVAHYGENEPQAWNAPYYYGESNVFSVEVDKIVDNLDPITCRLSNVKVSIVFDQSLINAMSEDSKVVVKVGESGELTFTKDTQDCGYFAYVEGSNTLAATFSGIVNNAPTTETKTYDNVKPGTHYSITFRQHSPNASGNGDAKPGEEDENGNGAIVVDAGVIEIDYSGDAVSNISPDEILLDDETERPKEEEPVIPDDPNVPDVPDDPVSGGPIAESIMPVDENGNAKGTLVVKLNEPNEVVDGLTCAFVVKSEAEGGFQSFKIEIDSDALTPDELSNVGLDANLDLVTPGEFEAALSGLGFPVNVGGMNEAQFDITDFLALLKILGPQTSTFKMTISDANGTSTINLILVVK